MNGFRPPQAFAFVPALEASFRAVRRELLALCVADFVASPDSLTTISGIHDETGWLQYGLVGEEDDFAAHRRRCPATVLALGAVPGLVHACFSLFRPGTHLHPHRGERPGLLRCHLPLLVPPGDVALRSGAEVRRWVPGRCLILDDTVEHEAWNHGTGDRVVLIVTFPSPAPTPP